MNALTETQRYLIQWVIECEGYSYGPFQSPDAAHCWAFDHWSNLAACKNVAIKPVFYIPASEGGAPAAARKETP